MRCLWLILTLALTLLGPAPGLEALTLLDFEELAPTEPPFDAGALTIVSSQGVTITRQMGGRFDVDDNSLSPPKPASFGARTLDPYFLDGDLFRAALPSAVSFVSIDLGDYGADVDFLVLNAYSTVDATGVPIAIAAGVLPSSPSFDFTFMTLSVSAAGIRSVTFGALDDNSVFADNLVLDSQRPIAAPGTLLLVCAGLFAAATRTALRRQRGEPELG